MHEHPHQVDAGSWRAAATYPLSRPVPDMWRHLDIASHLPPGLVQQVASRPGQSHPHHSWQA
ncbi:MAG: hypothetical protein M3Y35_14375, partial [Actinomycetota bacterium]|nr:hypothetical protein [Actinomycetota bacterium]